MRLELVPIILGFIVLLLGVAILWDAWGEQPTSPMRERRRRRRATLDPRGEALVGFGTMLLGAALIGRDWRFETLTVLVGTLLVLWGGFRSRQYIREMLFFRGRARRGLEDEMDKPSRLRIR